MTSSRTTTSIYIAARIRVKLRSVVETTILGKGTGGEVRRKGDGEGRVMGRMR
jgi:hypothetical protein